MKIDELLRGDLEIAKSPQELSNLTERMNELASQADDPVDRYALLSRARDLSIKGSDIATALAVIDRLADVYVIDKLAAKADCLEKALAQKPVQADVAANRSQLASIAGGLVDDAVAADNIPAAMRFGKIALAASQGSKSHDFIKQATARVTELKALHASWQAYSAAQKELVDHPDDPKANSEVGAYLCFMRFNWAEGLPHLAKSSNDGLRKLAEADLVSPSTTAEQVKLADRWWDAPAEVVGKNHSAAVLRAKEWYGSALPKLSGLEKARVEKRLGETLKRPVAHGPTTINGTWRDGDEIVTIVQKGSRFTADCKYRHPEHGEIHWRMTGTVSKDGQREGQGFDQKGAEAYAEKVGALCQQCFAHWAFTVDPKR